LSWCQLSSSSRGMAVTLLALALGKVCPLDEQLKRLVRDQAVALKKQVCMLWSFQVT